MHEIKQKKKKYKIHLTKKTSSLFYYDVIIFELELDLAQFFVVGVHNFSFSVWIYWSKLIKLVPAGK